MPWIIDYALVLDVMRGQGFVGRYYNGGAFDFPAPIQASEIRWTADDPGETAGRVAAAWRTASPGPVWLLPMSHWQHAFEQAGGNWLAAVIESTGVDAGQLSQRVSAAAIEFSDADAAFLERVIERLLTPPHPGSYTIAFPRRPVLCEIDPLARHVWWRTADASIAARIERVGVLSVGDSGPGA